ncbi:MAG: response regulator [Ignavibacteria bacterium RBG_13_36_8]|nr:MAG: response regulator [Ignavibacteria bacterium RBG_13_36_8]
MKKILIIDDHPDNVFILQDRLERESFEIITAYDGETGLRKAIEERPDLILLDIMMPGMSGYEVCRKLVETESTKGMPIILVTALTDAQDVKEGLLAGAFDYIKKPFNKVELIARINSALKYSESQKVLIEIEKINTYAATVLTANHEIKQPLTMINLSLAAIKRELGKTILSHDAIDKRVKFIEEATKTIIEILEKLSSIKRPVFTDYVNDLKMVDLKSEGSGTSAN